MDTRDAIASAAIAILLRASPELQRENLSHVFAIKAALKGLVWEYSEQTSIPGQKYESCPFWSERAFREWNTNRKTRNLRLEHVFTRKMATTALLEAKTSDQIRSILDALLTCTILNDEHPQIGTRQAFSVAPSTPEGWWLRYPFDRIAIRKGPRFDEADPRMKTFFERQLEEISLLAKAKQKVPDIVR